MDPKPEHRAHQGQDSGDVERALPAEALGKNRREGGGNRPTQMYTHVHKTGHRASVRRESNETRNVAEALAREILSLPLYPELPLDDVRTVAEAIREFES